MIPRSEYPRPQFVRKHWLCLNGQWQFEIDHDDSGRECGWLDRDLAQQITVPFCPESKLSGVDYQGFMQAVWYRRQIEIPADWTRKILLHFQACDYDTTVWVNGHELGNHRGGFTPISFEISQHVEPGSGAVVVVRARDYARQYKAGGKQQLDTYQHHGCYYQRTTGIWQTVWMEPVADTYLKRPRITPDLANNCFHIRQPLAGNRTDGLRVHVQVLARGQLVAESTVLADWDLTPELILQIQDHDRMLWHPDDPFLYDIQIRLLDTAGQLVDKAKSYAGLRSICLQGKKFLINGKPCFQRQVLDQGYYPDGLMTAPSDQALINDIELSMSVGFNSARLHQKIFEERFLYHADRLGYLVWSEFGDWGLHHQTGHFMSIDPWKHHPHNAMFRQWDEALERDYNHPCIIGWCPLNETHRFESDDIDALDDLTHGLYLMTKSIDATRPVLDASGYSHRVLNADVYDSHSYEQDPQRFSKQMAGLEHDEPYINPQIGSSGKLMNVPYTGQPYFCSEFGGIKWAPEFAEDAEKKQSWGYGNTPRSLEEFYERFAGLVTCLLQNPNMFGYCYTQLTDVFQEQNGLFTFDRVAKFDTAKLRSIQLELNDVHLEEESRTQAVICD